MVKKYRKKPIIIEAVKWDGNNFEEVKEFVGKYRNFRIPIINASIIIFTLEGEMKARKGDYIIKGIKGEFYPCKPDIFEETYEEIKTS